VNYSEANWNQLFKTLDNNHLSIHRLNRAQIIKDSLTLAKAGFLEYSFALQSTKYLKKEFDFIPWTTAMTELDYIGQMLIKSNALVNDNSTIANYNSAYENYKSYIFQQLGPIFDRLGLKQSD
jgi:aminopeptidase N